MITYFPMREGIRKIVIKQKTDSVRHQCADAAQYLWTDQGFMSSILARYSASGVIKAAASLKP